MYLNYKKGVMPFQGGYLEQPANIIELLNIVGGIFNEIEEEEMKKAQKKTK
jgi:hypothetical protein